MQGRRSPYLALERRLCESLNNSRKVVGTNYANASNREGLYEVECLYEHEHEDVG